MSFSARFGIILSLSFLFLEDGGDGSFGPLRGAVGGDAPEEDSSWSAEELLALGGLPSGVSFSEDKTLLAGGDDPDSGACSDTAMLEDSVVSASVMVTPFLN